MSETNTTAVVEVGPPTPQYKIGIEETVKTLLSYDAQAENSLTQLQANIDNANNQINEWRRIQLMIVGQRQLLKDLIGKTVELPKTEETTKPDTTVDAEVVKEEVK